MITGAGPSESGLSRSDSVDCKWKQDLFYCMRFAVFLNGSFLIGQVTTSVPI